MVGFVTAFPGPRDRYQLPLALAEVGLLDKLLTDLYPAGALRPSRAIPGRLAQRVGRGEPSIASHLVRPMPAVFAAMIAVYPSPVAVSRTGPITGAIVWIFRRVSSWGSIPLIRCMGNPASSIVGAPSVGSRL